MDLIRRIATHLADRFRDLVSAESAPHFGLRSLLRFGGWGVCAITAVAVAVFAVRTESGNDRANTAFATINGAQRQQALRTTGAEMLARADAEREARRTTDLVRILVADRERMAQRIAILERNLEDLTGSVKRQAEPRAPAVPPNAGPPPVTAKASPPAVAAAPAANRADEVPGRKDEPTPRPMIVPVEPLPAPEAPAATQAKSLPNNALTVLQAYASAASPVASVVAVTPPEAAAATPPTPRTEYALDLGTSPNLAGLRTLWEKTRSRQPSRLDGLQPLVSVREGTRPGSTELRLLAGPITNRAAVARICAALVVAGVPCQPALFEGQKLAQR